MYQTNMLNYTFKWIVHNVFQVGLGNQIIETNRGEINRMENNNVMTTRSSFIEKKTIL